MTHAIRALLGILAFTVVSCAAYVVDLPNGVGALADGGGSAGTHRSADGGVDAGLPNGFDAGLDAGRPSVDGGNVSPCQPQAYPAVISTTSQGFVDGNGCPVTLKGFVVDPYWGPGQGTFSLDAYQQIASAGFNAVRMWINWSDFEPSAGYFPTGPFATLNTAIGYAAQAGLYVILCPIFVNGGEARIPTWAREGDAVVDIRQHASGYLTHIAQLFKSNRAVAAYDLVNEPGGANTLPVNDILQMYAGAIGTVRSADPNKVVFIEPEWGDWGWVDVDWSLLPDRVNVALSMHDYYAGGAGSGYSSTGAGIGNCTWDGTSGYPNPNVDELEAHLLVQLHAAQGIGIPLQIGEFGVNPYAQNADLWVQHQVALFQKYGLSYIWWDYNCQSKTQRTNGGDAFAAADENCNFMPIISNLQ